MDWTEIKLQDINIRIKPGLKERYKKYCLERGIDMSSHIRNFIEKTLEINASHKNI